MRSLRSVLRFLAVVGLAMGVASCLHPNGSQQSTPRSEASGRGSAPQRLDHVSPARDSIGSVPKTFTWTAVPGADSYSIGIWNEIDMMVWRRNGIPTTSVTPDDLTLEPGTYFWSVSALRNGQELADSGLSAFVVRTSP